MVSATVDQLVEELPSKTKLLEVDEDQDEDEEVEEDGRIVKLYSFAEKQVDSDGRWTGDAAAYVTMLDELGTRNAAICGGNMCTDHHISRAHFVVASLIDADEMTVAESVVAKRKPLKASVEAGGAEAGKSLVACLERYATTDAEETATNVAEWDKVMRALWEYEIVSEEALRAWQDDERSARLLQVATKDAQAVRERGAAFFEWIEAGEDE